MDAKGESLPAFAGLAAPIDYSRTRTDLALWRTGDQQAFERIWNSYCRPLEVFIARRIRAVHNAAVRRRIDAEEILQDCMRTVIEGLDRFEYRGSGSFLRWMEAIAANTVRDCMDHWEAGRRDPNRERRSEESTSTSLFASVPPADPRSGPITEVIFRERRAHVVAALAELDVRDCQIVMMRVFYLASWAEVATEAGLPSEEAARKAFSRLLPSIAARMERLASKGD